MEESKIQEVNELKKIRQSLKTPEERADAWVDLIKNMAIMEQEMIDSVLLLEPVSPKHFKTELETKSVEDRILFFEKTKEEFEEKITKYSNTFNSVLKRLSLPVNTIERYKKYLSFSLEVKDLYIQDWKEAEEKVIVEAVNVYQKALEVRPENITKFINDSKSMITPFLFQPPVRTSEDSFEREILFNIYSHWDKNKLVMDCLNQINELFKNYK